MVDIGTASGTTEVSRVTVNEVPGTTTVIGAGTAGGPSRRVDVFEDAWVRGNARCGVATVVRVHFPDGGSLTTETPRIGTEVSNAELSIIGAGVNNSPNQRLVKVYDNLVISNNVSVLNDLLVTSDVAAGGTLNVTGTTTLNEVDATSLVTTGGVTVGGNLDVGSMAEWHTIRAQNAIVAAGTFHMYDRGAGVITNEVCGFGFSSSFFTPSVAYPPLTGIFSAKLILATPISCPVVVVTPWLVGQYDESNVTTTPLLLAPAIGIPLAVAPTLLIKGLPAGPPGALPAPSFCVQQIEVAFYSVAVGTNFIPGAPVESDPASDLVFDIKVCGCECVLSE